MVIENAITRQTNAFSLCRRPSYDVDLFNAKHFREKKSKKKIIIE